MRTLLRTRLRRRLLALFLGAALALACTELGLRWLVLSDSDLAHKLGAGLRNADWYASPSDDDFWKLLTHFDRPVAANAIWPDRVTGWRNSVVAADTYAHKDEATLGARTPLLLYGDSFAEGGQASGFTFEDLMSSSPLRDTHALLNYGVGGYGADQVLLLARATLPRFEARQPLAVLSLLVDDDLDRAVLGYRGGPKPRFHVEHGRLVEPEPVEPNLERYLRDHPLGVASYLAALCCRGPGLLPHGLQQWLRGDDTRRAEKEELGLALLREACRELRAHAQRSALMLMRARESVLNPQKAGWQEALVRRAAAEAGLPVLDSRGVLLRAIDGKLEHLDDLYVVDGPRVGHWNETGNRVVFQLLRAFAEGGTEEDALAHVAELVAEGELKGAPARRLDALSLGCALVVRWREDTNALCFIRSREEPGGLATWYLGLRAGNRGPSSFSWKLPAQTRRITLQLRVAGNAKSTQGAQELLVHAASRGADGAASDHTLTLRVGGPARELSLELAGSGLEVSVESPTAGERSPWLLFGQPRLE